MAGLTGFDVPQVNDDKQKFRHPTRADPGYVIEKYNAGCLSFYENF